MTDTETTTAVTARRLPCECCGAIREHDPDRIVLRRNDRGETDQYTRCGTCGPLASRSHAHLARAVIARELNIDVHDEALEGIDVEWFSDRPFAYAAVPNTTPWAHLDRADLAKRVKRSRQEIEARHGGPCHFCGTTETPKGTHWDRKAWTGRRIVQCGTCASWFDTATTTEDARAIAAAGMLGRCVFPVIRADGSYSGGRIVRAASAATAGGLLFWSELGVKEGNERPWQHVNRSAFKAAASAR